MTKKNQTRVVRHQHGLRTLSAGAVTIYVDYGVRDVAVRVARECGDAETLSGLVQRLLRQYVRAHTRTKSLAPASASVS